MQRYLPALMVALIATGTVTVAQRSLAVEPNCPEPSNSWRCDDPPPTTDPPPPSTTTAPPPPTTTDPPPSGGQFVEDFSTPAGFTDRFDKGWSGLDPSTLPDYVPHIDEWNGDHNHACGAPTTLRRVHIDVKDELFWWCAPNGPDTGHVMVGANTTGYNIAWLSPRQWFRDVSRVCWDMSLNRVSGGKWFQLVIAARTDIERVQTQLGRVDLGFTGPGFQVDGGPSTGVNPTAASGGVRVFQGNMQFWRGATFTTGFTDGEVIAADKATRFRHCAIDNGNGTVTLTQARPDGVVHSRTGPGAFPLGDVRVVWQDDMYDPPKRQHYSEDNLTWHLDNFEIS